MSPVRLIAAIAVALSALLVGAFVSLPTPSKEFVSVEVGGAEIIAEVADTPQSRQIGLSHHRRMPDSSGMLFVFGRRDRHVFWMKDMEFPIDIIWIRDGLIVDMEESAPAPAEGTSDSRLPVYAPDSPADFVLEVVAGFSKKHNVTIGDAVKITTRDGSIPEFILGYASSPAAKYFIETLRKKGTDGKKFTIVRYLSRTDAYATYQIGYKSGGLIVSGKMNVPRASAPERGFPMIVFARDTSHPQLYYDGRRGAFVREQDLFARRGYVTILPDYRGYGFSTLATPLLYDFYTSFSEDVLNLLDAVRRAHPRFIDLERIGLYGHGEGGNVALRVLVLDNGIRASILVSPASTDVRNALSNLPQEELIRLRNEIGEGTEAEEQYRKISPLTYAIDIAAAVQIHHGTDDTVMPYASSEILHNTLKDLGKRSELYLYEGEGEEYSERAWNIIHERSLQFFDQYMGRGRRSP